MPLDLLAERAGELRNWLTTIADLASVSSSPWPSPAEKGKGPSDGSPVNINKEHCPCIMARGPQPAASSIPHPPSWLYSLPSSVISNSRSAKFPPAFREDVLQEAIAAAFVVYRRLVERGSGGRVFASPLAQFAVLRVRDGRRVGSRANRQDVSCPFVARRHHFRVRSIDRVHRDFGRWTPLAISSRETPIPDQVAFRLDFKQWLSAQSRRNRRLIEALASGDTTSEAARQFQISAARVSQLRLQFYESWHAFLAEGPTPRITAAA